MSLLLSIAGGPDLTLTEVSDAARTIEMCADDNANIIYGQIIDDDMQDAVRITVIATGFKASPSQSSMNFSSRASEFQDPFAGEGAFTQAAQASPIMEHERQAPSTFSVSSSSSYVEDDYIPDFLKRQ